MDETKDEPVQIKHWNHPERTRWPGWWTHRVYGAMTDDTLADYDLRFAPSEWRIVDEFARGVRTG